MQFFLVKNTLAETVLVDFSPTTGKQLSQTTSSPAVLANTYGNLGICSLGAVSTMLPCSRGHS